MKDIRSQPKLILSKDRIADNKQKQNQQTGKLLRSLLLKILSKKGLVSWGRAKH